LTRFVWQDSRFAQLRSWGAVFALAAVLFVVLVRTAWLCDDAYITFRTVDNILNGYGPVWNTDERVQGSTHPLWMLLVTGLSWVTGEYRYTVIFLSMVLSATAIVLIIRQARTPTAAALALGLLIGSRAFVEYCSSGLENPLTHLLFAVFVTLLLRNHGPRRLLWLSLVAGLATLNRMDSLLLFLPALGLEFFSQRSWRAIGMLAVGFVPFALWELFSIAYYGFPFPNTAYAKLGTGIPRSQMLMQGLRYLRLLTLQDPISAIAMLAGVQAALMARRADLLSVALGMALYVTYVIWVGGDFMQGRFFATAVLGGAALLSQLPIRFRPRRDVLVAAVVLAVVGLVMCPNPPLASGRDYAVKGDPEFRSGIADERKYYFGTTGLLREEDNVDAWLLEGLDVRNGKETVVERATIGMYGLGAGPHRHVVDVFALTEPLLARLPALEDPNWRIGHFFRAIPAGYLAGLRRGENLIQDPNLRQYYDALSTVIKGPLFTAARWRAIADFNLGRYQYLIDQDVYRHYPARWVGLMEPSGAGVWAWKRPNTDETVPSDGIELRFPEAVTLAAVQIKLQYGEVGVLQFFNPGGPRTAVTLSPASGDVLDGSGYYCAEDLANRTGANYLRLHLLGNPKPDPGKPVVEMRVLSVRALEHAPRGFCMARFETD
jgi:arabinofuranosyltransferase